LNSQTASRLTGTRVGGELDDAIHDEARDASTVPLQADGLIACNTAFAARWLGQLAPSPASARAARSARIRLCICIAWRDAAIRLAIVKCCLLAQRGARFDVTAA
jgi:hypothetical protein